MARLRTFAPLLLALPLLLAGCDQVRELVGGSKNDAPARASGRAVRVTTVELTPQTVEIERELTGLYHSLSLGGSAPRSKRHSQGALLYRRRHGQGRRRTLPH